MDRLSVIIPVYRVDKYLRECVESVRAQTMKDMVIYLVDDGSEDESAKICDEYAETDSRVIVVHRKNGGLSAARNTSLGFVDTPYVTFLDSDDLLASVFAYETVVAEMERNNADLCLFAYRRFDDNSFSPKIESVNNITKPKHFTQKDLQEWLSNNSGNSHPVVVWNKIYKNELIKELRFEETNLVEDSRFVPRVFSAANNILRIEYPLIYYRDRVSSQSHGRSIKMCCDHILSEMTVLDYIVGTNNNKLIHNWLLRWIKLFFIDYFEVWKGKREEIKIDSSHLKYWKKACNTMKSYYYCVYPLIMDQTSLNKRIRWLCFLFKYTPHLAYCCFRSLKEKYFEA